MIKHSATTMKIFVDVWGRVKGGSVSSTKLPSFYALMDPLTRHLVVILVVLKKYWGDRTVHDSGWQRDRASALEIQHLK